MGWVQMLGLHQNLPQDPQTAIQHCYSSAPCLIVAKEARDEFYLLVEVQMYWCPTMSLSQRVPFSSSALLPYATWGNVHIVSWVAIVRGNIRLLEMDVVMRWTNDESGRDDVGF